MKKLLDDLVACNQRLLSDGSFHKLYSLTLFGGVAPVERVNENIRVEKDSNHLRLVRSFISSRVNFLPASTCWRLCIKCRYSSTVGFRNA